jgi:hypothetical protein
MFKRISLFLCFCVFNVGYGTNINQKQDFVENSKQKFDLISLKNGMWVPYELYGALSYLWNKLDKAQFKYVCEQYYETLKHRKLNSKNEPEESILNIIREYSRFLSFCVKYVYGNRRYSRIKGQKTRYWYLVPFSNPCNFL